INLQPEIGGSAIAGNIVRKEGKSHAARAGCGLAAEHGALHSPGTMHLIRVAELCAQPILWLPCSDPLSRSHSQMKLSSSAFESWSAFSDIARSGTSRSDSGMVPSGELGRRAISQLF